MPEVGESRQPSVFISVDLPLPEGPMIATYSPRSIVSDTPRRARTCGLAHHVGADHVLDPDYRLLTPSLITLPPRKPCRRSAG